jgi:hypothetical protein
MGGPQATRIVEQSQTPPASRLGNLLTMNLRR